MTERRSLVQTFNIGVSVVLIASLLGIWATRNDAGAEHLPANKTAVAGSETEVLGPGENVTLLTTQVKNPTPGDLILQVTAECALVTDVTTVGNDDQRAFGEVKVWVEIDGAAVAVADSDADQGKVVFCSRAYRRQTQNFNEDDTIRTFFDTRESSAFNWISVNAGGGPHTITVMATLTETETSSAANAEAVVGNRTLVVEPVKLPHDDVN